MKGRVAVGGALLVPLLIAGLSRRSDPLREFPDVVLWAWEARQDLRFVSPDRAGIAFLARTLWLRDGAVVSRPRLQPLLHHPDARLMAVVRMEASASPLP